MKNPELMLALFGLLGVVVVTGLVAIPVIEQVDAKECKNKRRYNNLQG